MPSRAPAACKRPGCAGLVQAGVCSVCGPLRRASAAEHDEQRGTAAQRGYGGRWQRVRAAYLAAHPLCAHCQQAGRIAAATDVHHVVPRRDGGSDRWDNLLPLCHSCHSRVTAGGG